MSYTLKILDHHDPLRNPPWLFGLLSIPYGLSNAIVTILMPYVLRKQGVAVDEIADIVAIALIPAVWYFVYSPVVDLGFRRRSWLIFADVGAALFAGAAILLVSSALALVTVLLFLSSAVSGLESTANGSLLMVLDPEKRGRASGWFQAGSLGGGALGGGLAIWLASRFTVPILAIAVFVMMAIPAVATILIDEPAPIRRALRPLMGDLFHDLADVMRSRRTLLGLIFFLSPVGSGAIANLISGMGPEYHASTTEVLWVTGIISGLLTSLGCLIGGFACDRMNRMKAYAFGGALTAVFALYMGFGPATPFTYGAGYSGYSIALGFSYAVFTALVLEVLGPRRHAAGTSYSILVASGNLPIVYMTWLDGVGFKQGGVRWLAGFDALGNLGGALVLWLLAMYVARFWKRSEPTTLEPAPVGSG